MSKSKNQKKCSALTNSGRKCDKQVYLNTNYCFTHQNKKVQTDSNKSKKRFLGISQS